MMSLALKEGYQITKKDSILFVDVENIFTGEIAKQYHQDMMQITEEMKHQPWASLIIYHGNGVFTPDAEEQIVDITKFRVKNNMVANATVFLQSAQADLQQIQLSRIYHGCNLPFYVFSDVKSAKNWLEDFLEKQAKAV